MTGDGTGPAAGVFEGLRVLDLSWGTAGPMAVMLLADNGASVTVVEPPGGPPFGAPSGTRVWRRGTRRARVDLGRPGGRRAVAALAAAADVVVTSYRPGVAERLGVDHATLSVANPGLVSCSITGYGRHPRHRDRPGYDALVMARTGLLLDVRGRPGTALAAIGDRPAPHAGFAAPPGLASGPPRPGPVLPRTPWPSVGAAYLAALGTAAALRAREVTGEGQLVETSLLQGALLAASLHWQRVGDPDGPDYWTWTGDGRAPVGLHRAADGRYVHHWALRPAWVLAAADGDGAPAPAARPAPYRHDPDRLAADESGLLAALVLHPLLAEAVARFPAADWVEAGARAGVGLAPVRSPAEALADPALRRAGFVAEVADPEAGPVRLAGRLLGFSETPGRVRGPAPRPGADTAAVLVEAAAATPAPPRPRRGALRHPLDGIRVLDLGIGVAGPYVGRVLADLGADVVRVNTPHDGAWNDTHLGLGCHRGARSLALDLHRPAGRAALDRLLERADVVVANWRPAAAARLGLDPATLTARFPRLVVCTVAGAEPGPWAERPGTDQTAAARTGVEWEDGGGHAGHPPLWTRLAMGDVGAALLAAFGVTAALGHRERTGRGQAVDTSLVQAGLFHASYASLGPAGTEDWRRVDGGGYGFGPGYRLYRCADGWIFVAAVRPDERRRLLEVAGLGDEPDEAALAGALADRFRAGTTAGWFARLDAAAVPVEVVDGDFCRTLFDDPDARALGLVAETTSAAVGRFEDPGLLVGFGSTPGVVRRGPCRCGEHSREVLLDHGFTPDEVDGLVAGGAVLDAAPADAVTAARGPEAGRTPDDPGPTMRPARPGPGGGTMTDDAVTAAAGRGRP